jgi:hypothetical protein
MSLTDKVIEELRDDTYAGGLVDRDEADEWAGKFSRFAASADAPFGAQMMLGCTVAAEVVAIAIVKFGFNYLLRLVDVASIAVFGTAFIFLTGFFGGFAAYKLYNEYITRDKDINVNDGPMSDIAEYNGSSNELTIYFISAGAGIANVVLVFFLLNM